MAFTAIGLCFAQNAARAQALPALTGKVISAGIVPIAQVSVAFHSLPDSLLVQTAFTDTAGWFRLEGLPEGRGFIVCSATGYKGYTSNVLTIRPDTREALPDVLMQVVAGVLNEVRVSGKKQLIIHKQDRVIVNIDALITAAGTTALDALGKSPGVIVDPNGNVSLRGKQGVTIYVDDKPMYLSGTELADYLRSIPASLVAQIELMSNPPARYDASGTAGIINIKTKKTATKGFNGLLNLALTQGQLTRSNNTLNLNYRTNKLSTFANLSYTLNNSFSDLGLNRVYTDQNNTPAAYFDQTSSFKRHGNLVSLRAGADYYYSARSTFGLLVSGMGRASSQTNDNISYLLNNARLMDSVIVAQNKEDIWYRNGGLTLNYQTHFNKKDHGLTLDADYLIYNNAQRQTFYNSGYLPNGLPLANDTLLGELPGLINIYSLKTDYTVSVTTTLKLDAGLKYSHTVTDNTAAYTGLTSGTASPDYNKSNHFVYKEDIGAAYLNLSSETGNLAMQGGLRAEQTHSNGHQLGNLIKPDSTFNRDYTSLFPTFYISYKFDSLATHQVSLNYGRRIERPYYQDLNPFTSPLDKFTYYNGNPFLRPSFVQSMELSHTYRNKLTTMLSYSRSLNDVNETIEIRNGIYYSRPGNIGQKTIISLSVDGSFDPAKWMNVHFYSEFTNIAAKSDFYTGVLNTEGNVWVLSSTIRLAPGKGWDGELNGSYRTSIYDAQFVLGSVWEANLAIQKKLSLRTTLRLSINDLFYSKVTKGEIGNLNRAQANWTNRIDSRNLVLSFSYRFGTAFNTDRKHETIGADAEKSRVKN